MIVVMVTIICFGFCIGCAMLFDCPSVCLLTITTAASLASIEIGLNTYLFKTALL